LSSNARWKCASTASNASTSERPGDVTVDELGHEREAAGVDELGHEPEPAGDSTSHSGSRV